jgi:hypothetical protein
MSVTREYKSPLHGFVYSVAGTIRVRLIKKLADTLDGIDLRSARVGDVLRLPQRDAQVLLAEGWAIAVGAGRLRAEAADGWTDEVPALPLPGDWELATACALNTVLVGPPRVTRTCVSALGARLRTPVVTIHPPAPLARPAVDEVRTLILHDVTVLPSADQQRLLEWLDHPRGQTRVISTSPTPLVKKVAEGAFLETLYYRLNTVYITVADDLLTDPPAAA